jgi:E3 SUMO-protein ligase PIAS1
VEQVIIEPDGKWSSPKEDEFKGAGGVTPATEDEDELIEIKEPGFVHVKQESLSASVLSLERTPAQSREPSATSSAARLSTNKRPAAQVIDLTGSDDDGDLSPVRPAKRLASNAPHRAYARPTFRNSFSSGLVNGGNFSFTNQTNSESPRHIGGFDA